MNKVSTLPARAPFGSVGAGMPAFAPAFAKHASAGEGRLATAGGKNDDNDPSPFQGLAEKMTTNDDK